MRCEHCDEYDISESAAVMQEPGKLCPSCMEYHIPDSRSAPCDLPSPAINTDTDEE